ncbi:enhancer of rudimentary [Neocallimastix lanati (nom. inval.)]|uniref:Enhancer of rudimentary homolog n=1 Tax=Neocallimastix californiae TaxID=1754190 RepID=A0A1Y2DCZ9_9FUNG|nr:enhancer of rudimentary [Neocallimastix sp. JGI-2020a]ORY57067.1 enhancer of rudimentary [Neocallimastix californiae]|eukprot:ORY57067.1 enhancer of rudimentary [Neocallimastix californiae]
MTQHTIILIQRKKARNSRTYMDFNTVALAIEELIRLYEGYLQEQNPNARNINYDISDLNEYIDHFEDIGCLVYEPSVQAYIPHDRDWIKSRIFNHLKKLSRR